MALFGFGYDGDFLKVLGEPWAGVQEAERGLAREAQKSGRSVDEIRRQRQAVYDRWHEEQTRDEEAAASSRADAAAPAPAAPKRGPLAGG
jgi:hypothetical protein